MEALKLIGSMSLNEMVLKYLSSIRPNTTVYASWDSVPNAYVNCGCHPDIVEWLWDTVGRTLPKDCRCLIHRCPALFHPESGVIFAIAMGFEHGIRVPQILQAEAIMAGATKIHNWSTGNSTNIELEVGAEWLFGFGGPAEIALISLAYSEYGSKYKAA